MTNIERYADHQAHVRAIDTIQSLKAMLELAGIIDECHQHNPMDDGDPHFIPTGAA